MKRAYRIAAFAVLTFTMLFLAGAAGAETVLLLNGLAPGYPPSLRIDVALHTETVDTARSVGMKLAGAEATASFDGLPGGKVVLRAQLDAPAGETIITQSGATDAAGLWGVSWSLSGIPYEYNILVPGSSGLKLTREGPGGDQTFDYPMTWEAQLVVIEGDKGGMYVWAEDPDSRYKRLTVERKADGWRLTFHTINNAPFSDDSTCDSVPWRLGSYKGDWRVPAKRYRDWAAKAFQPTPLEAQRPAWVKDASACIITSLDPKALDWLAERTIPGKTLLYLPMWRAAGYDMDYPDYDKVLPEFPPFLEKAKAMGFRVMLHVNYFGVDFRNPVYAQFEPYQVRNPFGAHDKEWWLRDKQEPIIKFAYINPAHKPWRDLFVDRMRALCAAYPVDALHLDQTLCIYNDHNGLMDGQTMAQGNIALHMELREALPDVALSGEGLNEVTYRYEAFTQRHVAGMDHERGTWQVPFLKAAHPISSYLLRPYTCIYGYLGMSAPSSPQAYAAWREAYQHWGVIPTLALWNTPPTDPALFLRQFIDEVSLWQREDVTPDMEAPWPGDVAFPWRTRAGDPISRLTDGRLMAGGKEVSRTLFGATETSDGVIPGWAGVDAKTNHLIGLDPSLWHAVFPADALSTADAPPIRVSSLPKGMVLREVEDTPEWLRIRCMPLTDIVLDAVTAFWRAETGVVYANGAAPVRHEGPLEQSDGARFSPGWSGLNAHPPYKTEGSGSVFARFKVDLPKAGAIWFRGTVTLGAGATAEGKCDGVHYTVAASGASGDGKREILANDILVTEEKVFPLDLDLSAMAGQTIALTLTVDPGPAGNPLCDWAAWPQARIEATTSPGGQMTVSFSGEASPGEAILAGTGKRAEQAPGSPLTLNLPIAASGDTFILKRTPKTATPPLSLLAPPFTVTFIADSGQLLVDPQYAGAVPSGTALDIHPPDRGRTVVSHCIQLPAGPLRVKARVGLRPNAKTSGVRFAIMLNGAETCAAVLHEGDPFQPMEADLSPWAGQAVVIQLVTDAMGDYGFDWARWEECGVG